MTTHKLDSTAKAVPAEAVDSSNRLQLVLKHVELQPVTLPHSTASSSEADGVGSARLGFWVGDRGLGVEEAVESEIHW